MNRKIQMGKGIILLFRLHLSSDHPLWIFNRILSLWIIPTPSLQPVNLSLINSQIYYSLCYPINFPSISLLTFWTSPSLWQVAKTSFKFSVVLLVLIPLMPKALVNFLLPQLYWLHLPKLSQSIPRSPKLLQEFKVYLVQTSCLFQRMLQTQSMLKAFLLMPLREKLLVICQSLNHFRHLPSIPRLQICEINSKREKTWWKGNLLFRWFWKCLPNYSCR